MNSGKARFATAPALQDKREQLQQNRHPNSTLAVFATPPISALRGSSAAASGASRAFREPRARNEGHSLSDKGDP